MYPKLWYMDVVVTLNTLSLKENLRSSSYFILKEISYDSRRLEKVPR